MQTMHSDFLFKTCMLMHRTTTSTHWAQHRQTQHTLELQRQDPIQVFLPQSPQSSGGDQYLHDTANDHCRRYRKHNPTMRHNTTTKKTKIWTNLDPRRLLMK